MSTEFPDFVLVNVIDTCSIWNLLSSKTMFIASKHKGCNFCCTHFVYYECLIKKRKTQKPSDLELQARLRDEIQSFPICPITISDLQSVEIENNRKRLSKGELSSVAFAKKAGLAFITDDKKALKLSERVIGSKKSQTTPQLFGWLCYSGALNDADKVAVFSELTGLNDSLIPRLEEAYQFACACR